MGGQNQKHQQGGNQIRQVTGRVKRAVKAENETDRCCLFVRPSMSIHLLVERERIGCPKRFSLFVFNRLFLRDEKDQKKDEEKTKGGSEAGSEARLK